MMINCPKCNLLQTKDQYCAQCGVNMETYKPPAPPLWKKFLSNWMVQLGLLFAVIFVMVFLDSVSQDEDGGFEENYPTVTQTTGSSRQESFAASSANLENTKVVGERVTDPKEAQETFNDQSIKDTSSKQNNEKPLKKQAYFRLSMMSRPLIEKLAAKAKKAEANTMVLNRQEFKQLAQDNNADLRSMGQIRRVYQFGQPQPLFVGEEDRETGLNIGYFLQVIVDSNSNYKNIKATVRAWNQLQLNGDIGVQATYDVNLSGDSVFIIIDPATHEIEFTSEERTLFDSSSKLRTLNSEAFIDDLAEIVLILSMN